MKNLVLAFILISQYGLAQQTGEIDYPYLGIKFTVPTNWIGQEYGEGFLMGSNTEPGLIYMVTHEARNLEELKSEARRGIMEDDGTMLRLKGELEEFQRMAIGGTFEGVLQGTQQVNAYIAASLNPHGTGVTVISMTDPQNFSGRYNDLAWMVIKSLKFSQPKESPIAREWNETLKGAKLTYLESYSSSGYDSYGGYSMRKEILLCPNGKFSYYGSSSISVDTGGAYGSGSGQSDGMGTWSVKGTGAQTTELVLSYYNGEESVYELSYEDEKTYLNGSRYFRTYDHNECY